jgi:hypothetical protein
LQIQVLLFAVARAGGPRGEKTRSSSSFGLTPRCLQRAGPPGGDARPHAAHRWTRAWPGTLRLLRGDVLRHCRSRTVFRRGTRSCRCPATWWSGDVEPMG